MRFVLLILFVSLIISCEKNYEPLGDGNVFLETTQDSYFIGDSVQIYLVNESDRPVYFDRPGGWVLSKKVGGEWQVIESAVIALVLFPSNKLQGYRNLVFQRAFQDTGLYKVRFFLSWDKEGKYRDGLELIITSPFEIKNGT
jgi:hypothetical protein